MKMQLLCGAYAVSLDSMHLCEPCLRLRLNVMLHRGQTPASSLWSACH